MRSEFLDDLRDLPELARIPVEAYVLLAIRREMLRDVIEGPAKAARLRLEDGLAAQLVADTSDGEALPLLAFVLRQLSDAVPLGGTLTLLRYQDLGGVRGALARHADAALAEALRTSGLTERDVLVGLTGLVTVDENGRRGRRPFKVTNLDDRLRGALQVLVDRRLLISDTDDDGQVWLTVAHEALFTEWRPLDAATAETAVALRAAPDGRAGGRGLDRRRSTYYYLWDDERLVGTLGLLGIAEDGVDPRDRHAARCRAGRRVRRIPHRQCPTCAVDEGTRAASAEPHGLWALRTPGTCRRRRCRRGSRSATQRTQGPVHGHRPWDGGPGRADPRTRPARRAAARCGRRTV